MSRLEQRKRKDDHLASVSSGAYTVIVDDNFHYQDPDYRTQIPGFASAEQAVEKCKRIVDACLEGCAEPGRSAKDIFEHYQFFGDDSWIQGPRDAAAVQFSAWDYAKQNAHRFVQLGQV